MAFVGTAPLRVLSLLRCPSASASSVCPTASSTLSRPARLLSGSRFVSASHARAPPPAFATRMSTTGPTTTDAGKLPVNKDPKTMTESDWRKVLTADEYRVLREKGTEYPGMGEYEGFYPDEGHFVCRACGNPIYSASSKFKSGCGWPAFDMCYKGSIATKIDGTFGMRRIEIMCEKCSGHLGHVFEGESLTATNERHCVNSTSLKYISEKGPDSNLEKLL